YASRKIELLTLQEARSATTPAFVKPADGKIFEPTVYASGADLPTEEHVDGSIPVLRSEIMNFRLEVRCFIHDRQIVTLSPYWRNDALALDEEGIWSFRDGEEAAARSFAEQVIGDERVALPPACTVDVGFDAKGHWAVIEANPCWGAGLYGCDPEKVLRSLGGAVMKKSDLMPQDLQWVSKRRREELEKSS
ncbi:MAG: hypothetical protein JWO82_2224, partial [Akkermansiaceae bacterium]|nr:hypothetical protein [Akkermansiaceae bacterium]